MLAYFGRMISTAFPLKLQFPAQTGYHIAEPAGFSRRRALWRHHHDVQDPSPPRVAR